MTRISFIIDDLRVGGSEVFLRELVLALRKRHRVRVIGLTGDGPTGDELRRAAVAVDVLGFRKRKAHSVFLDIVEILNEERTEVLHCERLIAGVLGVPAGRITGVRRTFVRRGNLPWWPSRPVRILDRWTMALATGVITPTRAVRDGYIAAHGLAASRFHLLPHGLARPPTFPTRSERKRAMGIVGCVANFNWRKDHTTLFEAFAAVTQHFPDARLKLVGSGPDEQKLRAATRELGVDAVTDFLGHRDDVPVVLHDFDCLVLPSKTEGFGRVLIEAMAAGVPVIATAVGGIPEVVTHARTGLLVPPSDPAALSSALLHLLRDRRARQELATSAFEHVGEHFDFQTVVRAYENIVLPRSRGRPPASK